MLRRPWVLAELTRAHSTGVPVHTILLEYPGNANDPKTFRFPDDLEAAIQEWSWYVLQEGKAQHTISRRRRASESVVAGARAITRLRSRSLSHKVASASKQPRADCAPHGGAPKLSPATEERLLGTLDA